MRFFLLATFLLFTWGAAPSWAQTLAVSNDVSKAVTLLNTTATLTGRAELRLSGTGDPLTGSVVHLNSPDAWLILENIAPSTVASTFLGRVRVNGAAAVSGTNVRVVQFRQGAVVIPHGPDFRPLEVFEGANFTGASKWLRQYDKHNAITLGPLSQAVSSFRLKRGYMATFAANENGTGASRVYVAQDGDVEVGVMPSALNNAVRFVRVFPWRWVGKKGFAGNIWQNLDIDWYYNWNLDKNSTLDIEYVAIRQTRWWPGLDQDWKARGTNHLLGYNEPDHANQANMTVAEAISGWPELQGTGLRLGAPAVTDGGTSWLYSFIDAADAAGLRVDFVPVHYYRSYSNPGDPDGAANQYYSFLKAIYDRTKRPIWVTEFNNGANWTNDLHDPTWAQQTAAMTKMIQMLDNAPFVERYAVYNWVEDVRRVVWDDGWPTDAGVVYRDNKAPLNFQQDFPDNGATANAQYLFDGDTRDASGNGHDAVPVGIPDFTAGRAGQALRFDGTDSYLQLPVRLGDSTDFTFSAWVNWNGGANWQRILDLGDGTQKHLFLTPKAGNGMLRFTMKNGGGEQQLNHTAPLPAGVWTHVAVTLAGDTGKLFVNGALVATNTAMTINPADLGTRLNYLGKSQFADPLFAGRMDDVRIQNAALTDAQVAALASAALPQFSAAVLTPGSAVAGQPWTGSIAAAATGGTGTRTFTKTGGPGWLAVTVDGRLTGVPGVADAGVNEFQVRVSVPSGGSATATVSVPVVLPHRTVVRYPFNGNANAAAGGQQGVVSGGPGYTSGRVGQGIILDGVDDFVTLPASVARTEEITIATWMLWSASSVWQRVYDFGNGTGDYFFLTPRSATNRMAFTIRSNGVEHTVDTASPALNTWTHVATTIGGGTMKLFVNGVQVASGATTLTPADLLSATNYLGKSQWPDPMFSGRLDEFQILDRALTAPELLAMMNGLPPVFSSDPITRPAAVAGQVYEQTLAGSATDPNAGTLLTFSKVSGPRWLTVDGYGRISGVPGASDIGQNRFIIRATDPTGLAADAVLTINVPGPADLLGHWQMDGNVTSHNGIAGTASGAPVFVNGPYDRALDFDGVNDLVTLPAGILSTATDFTATARVRWEGGTSWQRIFDFGTGLTQYLVLTPRSGSNTLRFVIKNGGTEQIMESAALIPGDWAQVAVTLSGNTGTLYVNGVMVDTEAITIDPSAFNPNLNYLGDSQFAADPFLSGTVDDLRLYRRGLNAGEILALSFPAEPVVVPDYTYGGWASAQGLSPLPAASGVLDPDNDGLLNVTEFVLGGSASQNDAGLLPQAQVRSSSELGASATAGKTYLTLQARLRRNRPGIIVSAEAAESLGGFALPQAAIQAGPPVVEGEFETITWHHPVAMEDMPEGRGFLRMKVQAN